MWTQRILNRADYADLLTSMNGSAYETVASVYQMDSSRILTILAYCSVFIIGLVGNAWVAYVIAHVLRQPRRESPRCVQVYILALCLGDFVILLFSLFLIMDLMYNAWVVESVLLCRLYLSSESLNKFYVPFVLVVLSYFCYVKICRPHAQVRRAPNRCLDLFDSIKIGSTRSAVVLASLCAAFAFILCAPVYAYGDLHYLVFDAVINESERMANFQQRPTMMVMPKCAFSPPDFLFNAFTVYSFVGGFALPASLFTYFYSAILWSSRRRQRESITRLGAQHGHGHKSQFWRVAKTASGLVSFYLLCWSPYWIVNLWHAWSPVDTAQEASQEHDESTEQEDQTPSDFAVVFGYFIHMLPYINCTGYPILYTLLNRQIIDAYRTRGRSRSIQNGRDSLTRASNGFALESNQMNARSSFKAASRYSSGNSQLLRANSCASVVGLHGEIETSLSTRRLTLSPSASAL